MYHEYEREFDSDKKVPSPRITVSISVKGEPWGTCNFGSWQEIIDYLQPRADEEKKCKEKGQ